MRARVPWGCEAQRQPSGCYGSRDRGNTLAAVGRSYKLRSPGFGVARCEDRDADGIDSSLRSSPFGHTACVCRAT